MDDDLRCSAWTRSHQVDPIGTAGTYRGFLLVEWPLPWPRDVADIEGLSDVVAAAGPARTRVQALVPKASGAQSVSFYRWDPDIGRYRGVEASGGGNPAQVALELLSGERPAGSRFVDGVEVLICGHGRRDRCCGSMGPPLEASLHDGGFDAEVRLRRTSHTGGHRFAPTAIVLPYGTVWGYLDEASVRSIAGRSGAVAEQLHRYRGCTGMPGPAAQALERAVLEVVGWPLFDWSRSAEDLGDGIVGLVATSPDGVRRYWKGRVVTRRVLPVPPCGRPVVEAEKSEAELAVEGLQEVS